MSLAVSSPSYSVGLTGSAADDHFAKTADEIRAKIGNRMLSLVDVKMNQILVAVWERPKTRTLGNGAVIHLPDSADLVTEQKYQGKTGLVLKLGPRAFESDQNVTYDDADRVDVGDWVVFRAGEGMRLGLQGCECILTTERGIKMRVPYPDMVY